MKIYYQDGKSFYYHLAYSDNKPLRKEEGGMKYVYNLGN